MKRSYIYAAIAIVIIIVLLRFFLMYFGYIMVGIGILWLVKTLFMKREVTSESMYEQPDISKSDDIIDVDYKVVDEKENQE